MLCGLLIGVLMDVYGTQKVAVVASLVFSASMIASSFAKELFVLYFTRGVIIGIAEGAVMMAATQVTATMVHDPKLRSNALAFLWTGAGLGAIVISISGQAVLHHGSWREYYRMLASFGGIVFAMAFFFVEDTGKSSEESDKMKLSKEALVKSSSIFLALGVVDKSRSNEALFKAKKSTGTCAELAEGFRRAKMAFLSGASLYKDHDFLLMGLAWNFYGAALWTPFIFAVSPA